MFTLTQNRHQQHEFD